MKRILVPCDFSEPAIQAFRFAVEIAQQSKGEIALLHVVDIPVMYDTVLMPTLQFEADTIREMKAKAEKDFEKMRTKWSKGGIVIRSIVEFGSATPTIIRVIKEQKSDLVIMGTKGVTGLKEFFVGSNTEKIVRSSPVPVMAVKKSAKVSTVKNIVFPSTLGESVEEENLTMKVKELQSFFKAKLHVVYVNTPVNFNFDVNTKQELKKFAQRYMLKNYTLNVYNDLNTENGVLHFAHEIGADMIAMSTHGRKGLSHFLNGSIAEDVVNHVDCPIWTCSTRQIHGRTGKQFEKILEEG